jgi:L-ribulose-5-phosphate 4-epimerase
MTFNELRQEVHWANVSLPKAGLVTMHSGNASGLHRESGIMLIKPSGLDYERMRSEDLVAVRLDGRLATAAEIPDGVESRCRPSVDTPHHLGLYRADPGLGGVVHTHSNHATAWAALEKPIPCALTAVADEFGGDIPCTAYVDNQGDNIVRALLAHRSRGPAVLLGRHGVFTFDRTPRAAFKAAVMVEDVARTLLLVRMLGEPRPLPATEIAKWWERYHTGYGQPGPTE